jgi:hypothetical protein
LKLYPVIIIERTSIMENEQSKGRLNRVRAYCEYCKDWFPVTPMEPLICPKCNKERKDFPYWKEEFEPLYKGYQAWYNEVGPNYPIKYDDWGDAHRIFMIQCNYLYPKSRLEVLEILKNATRENPIKYQDGIYWSERE